MSLDKYRQILNELDGKLQKLLEERFSLSQKIGLYKFKNKLPIFDANREEEILKGISGKYRADIQDIYRLILLKSKEKQKYDYFLVGSNLPYSFSPLIYQFYGINNYQLLECDDFSLVLNHKFKGLNITNPYKHRAYITCERVSEIAKRSESVNIIIKDENNLFGDNTDYYGFNALLDYYCFNPKGKHCLIIGNGATAKLIALVLKDRKASKVSFIVRNKRTEAEVLLSEYRNFKNCDFIINATPYGTYPKIELRPLFPLAEFKNLAGVIDLIYNPGLTPLIREAKKYQIPTADGLYMLVAQASRNAAYFLGRKTNEILEVYRKLKYFRTNIVLIGMPYSGKSRLGELLSKALDKELVDIDRKLEEKGLGINSLLLKEGLDSFRKAEAIETIHYAGKWNQIIACGGGIVLSQEAMEHLQNNGLILFLDVNQERLASRIDGTRPLIKSRQDLFRTYQERIKLYRNYADLIIGEEEEITEIKVKINEYLCD